MKTYMFLNDGFADFEIVGVKISDSDDEDDS